MNKTFLISILIGLISISCSESKDKDKLEGIFGLKLGMSEKEIREVTNASLLKEIEFENPLWRGKAIEEKKLKIFSLPRYGVDENYTIEDITLSFSEDKLYTINISKYNSKTEELLTQKYGTPKISDEVSDEIADTKEQLRFIKKEWHTNASNNICMSMQLTDLNDSLVRYNLIIYNYKKEKQAHESVQNFWRNFQQDMQKIKEDLNQPLIDKL